MAEAKNGFGDKILLAELQVGDDDRDLAAGYYQEDDRQEEKCEHVVEGVPPD